MFVFVSTLLFAQGGSSFSLLQSSGISRHFLRLTSDTDTRPTSDCVQAVNPGCAVVMSPPRASFTSSELLIVLFHVKAHYNVCSPILRSYPILKRVQASLLICPQIGFRARGLESSHYLKGLTLKISPSSTDSNCNLKLWCAEAITSFNFVPLGRRTSAQLIDHCYQASKTPDDRCHLASDRS